MILPPAFRPCGFTLFNTVALLQRQVDAREVQWERIAEEQLGFVDAIAKAHMHQLSSIIRFVVVEVAANSILTGDGSHSDHGVAEVGPTVNLNDDAIRISDMDDFVRKCRHS